MVEMRVRGLKVDAQSGQPAVILSDISETRFLEIWWIGVYENEAIFLALAKIAAPRPTTHDLLRTTIELLHGKLDRVVIHSFDEKTSTYYAKLVVIQEGVEHPLEVDARPSDSIALALRCGAPIYVSEAVLSRPDVILDKKKVNREIEEFRKFLENVTPSDFDRYDRSHGGGSNPDHNQDGGDPPAK